MRFDPGYPKSVAELDLDSVIIAPEILAVVRDFARSHPWRGSVEERQQKFRRLHHDLFGVLQVPPPRLIFATDERQDSGRSCFIPALNVIALKGKLSVITYLHEVGHVIAGSSEHVACTWSLSIFKTCFPRSWKKLKFRGHFATSGE